LFLGERKQQLFRHGSRQQDSEVSLYLHATKYIPEVNVTMSYTECNRSHDQYIRYTKEEGQQWNQPCTIRNNQLEAVPNVMSCQAVIKPIPELIDSIIRQKLQQGKIYELHWFILHATN
jgi:hypothetical protein